MIVVCRIRYTCRRVPVNLMFRMVLSNVIVDVTIPRRSFVFGQSRAKVSVRGFTGRTQQVKLPGVLSRHGEVIAGVPQGGVISPTLFNVHVDCIPRGIPVSTCKYADDCTLYELVLIDSVSQMQNAVTHLQRWAVQNKMELNAKKTKDMWITFKKSCPMPLLLISGLLNWRGFQTRGVLSRILDRGVPRRFVNPNPI